MIIEVKVPQLSESVSEATLVAWHKKEGEAVTRDESLIDIETDKVVLETPAPDGGVLVKIFKNNGDSVASGDVLAHIDTEAKSTGTTASAPAAAPLSAPSVASASAPAAKANASKDAPAMPAARKMIEEKGLDGGAIDGTGRGGRVTKGDVLAHVEQPAKAVPSASSAASSSSSMASSKPALAHPALPANVENALADRTEQRVPMSRLRARIAERLVHSQSTAAILTTFNEVNMAPVMELRNKYKEKFEKEHGVKLGFMSFFVKAAVAALKKYPVLNASIDGSDIVYHGYFDIGVAVGSPRGLVVPILRDVDQMSLAEIEKKISEFGTKAKDGKLSLEELTGGTFSISNGGVYGSMLSTPIINPPQSAILGIHATKDRAVVENGQIVIRPINYMALSYDHRIVDGREAVLGLVAMKEALEDPARLLLDV